MPGAGLDRVKHLVVVMLENRSFDHLLGFLYTGAGNVSPNADAFEGLTGTESCPGPDGRPVTVWPVTPQTPDAYFMPGADPGEGWAATNAQLYGSPGAPPAGAVAPMSGFVTDYAAAIEQDRTRGWYVFDGTTPAWVMGCYTPQTLPVLSGLARGFAVCDHGYASAPTMTMPNRAFACAGTSQGHMDDQTKKFTCRSIFGALMAANVPWRIYGYDTAPLTRLDFADIAAAPAARFGKFADFKADAAAGALPAYAFLEPSWSSTGNSQHPNYNMALGEQFLLEVYRAVRDGPGWDSTLLIITYDEHGGCYDHVPPPWGTVAPDDSVGELGFDFTRYGPRVPAVLVSPLIPAGSVIRVPDGATPFDHTSILATLEHRWRLPPLTRRDAAAPDVAAALSLSKPRADDPLAGITAPTPPANPIGLAVSVSHLQQLHAELIAGQTGRDDTPPATLASNDDYRRYIRNHETPGARLAAD